MRFHKGMLVVAMVLLLTLVQAALAGMATFTRRATDDTMATERAATASYAAQLMAAGERMPEGIQAVGHSVLLASVDVAGTLQILQTVSDAAGVKVVTAKASQSSTVGRQSFQITGRGTTEQVCAFVAGIEQHERLIVVENGRLSPGSADQVNFELGLATYHSGGVK